MNLYLSPRIGDGTYENKFRSRHREIDSARGQVNIKAGYYLVSSDTPIIGGGAIKLGCVNEKPAIAAIKALSRLGAEVNGATLAEAVFNLLRYPTIPNLKPLTPGSRAGGYELVMNGRQLFIEPHISLKWVNTLTEWQWVKDRYIELRSEGYWHQGAWALAASSLSDDFSGGAETPATGWTMVSGGEGGALNQLSGGTGQFNPDNTHEDHFMRFDTVLDSADMTVTGDFNSRKTGSNSSRIGGGPGGRKANDTVETYYYFGQRGGNTDEVELAVLLAGSFDLVGTTTRESHTISDGEVFYLTCDGSTISGGIDDVESISDTDNDIDGTTVGGKYAGLYNRSAASAGYDWDWNGWTAEDLNAGAGGGPTAGTLSLLGVGI